MKRLLWLGVLAACLGSFPGRAHAWGMCDWCPPMQIDAGVNAHFNVHRYDWGTNAQLGPWYLYFPYEAHFQTPAPVHPYPNWPGPMVMEPTPGAAPPGPPGLPAAPVLPPPLGPKTAPAPGNTLPPPLPGPGTGPELQPTSYYRLPQVPAYRPTFYPYPQVPAYAAPSYWYGW